MTLTWASVGGNAPLFYIPITLTNSQSQTTAANLPVKVSINSNTNSADYQAALLNVNWQDGAGNILKSWLESGETNTSTASVYWVNLGANTITASGGTLIIYQVIYGTVVIAMDGSNTGAEPNYTGTYAQYDNGTSVFTEYWNFAGASLPAGWTDAYGGTAPVVNNGLTISNNEGGSVYRTAATAYNSAGYVFETQMKDTNAGNQTTGGFTICNAQNPQGGNGGSNALVLYCCNAPSFVYDGWAADGSSSSYNIFSGSTLFTATINVFWIASIVCGNSTTNKVNLYKDYGSVKSSSGYIHSTMYIILGLKAGSGADSYTTHQWVYQWVRSRIDPPNDTNPSVSAGSIVSLPSAHTNTYIIDSKLTKRYTSTYLIDSKLTKRVQNPFNVDADFKKFKVQLPNVIDSNFYNKPTIVTGAEWFVNGNFETGDLTGWGYGGGEVQPSVTTTDPHSGTYCCQLYASNNDSLNQGFFDPNGNNVIVVSNIESFGFWYRNLSTDDGVNAQVQLNLTDGTNSYFIADSLNANTTSWAYYDIQALLVLNGYASGTYWVQNIKISNNTDGDVFVDDFSLQYPFGDAGVGLDVCLCSPIGGEEVTNGGFEDGNFTGWQPNGGATVVTTTPHSGTYCCDLLNGQSYGEIYTSMNGQDNLFILWSRVQSFTMWFMNTDPLSDGFLTVYTNLGAYSIELENATSLWTEIDIMAQMIAQGPPDPNEVVTSIEVYMNGSGTGTLLVDDFSLIASPIGHSFSPYSIDTTLFKSPNSLYQIDSDFGRTIYPSYNMDVILRNLVTTETSTNQIDVLFNHPYRYSIDSDLKKLKVDVTDFIDVLCKKLKITKTTLVDTIFARAKQYSIDAKLQAAVPVQYAIDTDFEAHGVQVQYIIDTRFIKTYTSTYSIDAVISLSNFPVTDLVDSLFKELNIQETTGVDVILLNNTPPLPPIYVQQTLRFVNPNGDLWVFPTDWKENQDCTPAIRQVPLAESEYLDKDTYVLKTREIDVTFRLSDSEKEILENVYNFASTEGANDFTDIYLYFNNQDTDTGVHPKPAPSVPKYTWHYVAWLSNKDYKYEYAFQDGRYVRWWTVSLTINVESFSGSSANEPDYSETPFSMAVVLAGHKLMHILDFERSDKHPPFLPEWVNQPAEVDSYIWNECVLDMSYTDKMSNDEKYLMDLALLGHQKVNLADYIHNVQGSVWISSIKATFDAKNWAKPWNVEIAIQANNNEVSFNSQASVTLDSEGIADGVDIGPDHEGTLYIDENTSPFTLPSSGNTMQCGVHVFYFFLPSIASGFTAWSVSGNAVIVGEDTYDVQTWDRESRVSVLIYGACTIIAQYTMPATEQCVTIALDSGLNDSTITNVGLIAIGNVWQGSGSNSLTNGGFETGSINPWGQIGEAPTEQVVNGGFEDGNFTGWTNTGNFISSNPATVHSGSYSLGIYEQLTTQTFGAPIPVSSITSFSFWAQGNSFVNGSFLVVTYTDATYTNFPINFTNGGAVTYYQFFPLSSLTAGKSIASIAFRGGLEGVIYIDDVALISTEGWVLNGPQAHSGNYCIKRSSVATAGIEQSSLSINVDDVIEAYFWAWTDQIALGFELIVNMGGAGTIDYTFYAPNPETWTQFDFLHLLAPYLGEGAVINSVTINALGSGCIIANIYLDDIVISIGGLPADFNGELFLGQPYSLQWMTDTSNPTAVFDHWEVVCGDITIANPASVSTTFTMNSGTLAWIRAIYVDTDPILYFTSLNEQYGTYNNGGIYINEQITSLPLTAHYSDVHGVSGLLQFAPPNVCQDTFVTWWTDNPSQITFGNPTDYFTTFTATGSGIIRAVFRGPNS